MTCNKCGKEIVRLGILTEEEEEKIRPYDMNIATAASISDASKYKSIKNLKKSYFTKAIKTYSKNLDEYNTILGSICLSKGFSPLDVFVWLNPETGRYELARHIYE